LSVCDMRIEESRVNSRLKAAIRNCRSVGESASTSARMINNNCLGLSNNQHQYTTSVFTSKNASSEASCSPGCPRRPCAKTDPRPDRHPSASILRRRSCLDSIHHPGCRQRCHGRFSSQLAHCPKRCHYWVDARSLLDDGQYDLVSHGSLSLRACLLTRLRQQRHLPATLHRPIQTRPRLCNHHTRHQLDSHNLLHQGIAYTTLLVGPTVLQRCPYDLSRRLGLSVERT
jgi:hypothetical protein